MTATIAVLVFTVLFDVAVLAALGWLVVWAVRRARQRAVHAAPVQAAGSRAPEELAELNAKLKSVGARDETIVYAVRCWHGMDLNEGAKRGWLVATNRRMWWFGRAFGLGALIYSGEEIEFSYAEYVSISTGIWGATLHIAGAQFQMNAEEAQRFAALIRDVQNKADDKARNNAMSPNVDQLARLAELRDRRVITEEEFQQKKAEILGRPW